MAGGNDPPPITAPQAGGVPSPTPASPHFGSSGPGPPLLHLHTRAPGKTAKLPPIKGMCLDFRSALGGFAWETLPSSRSPHPRQKRPQSGRLLPPSPQEATPPPLAHTQIFGSVVGLGRRKTPAPPEQGTGEYRGGGGGQRQGPSPPPHQRTGFLWLRH